MGKSKVRVIFQWVFPSVRISFQGFSLLCSSLTVFWPPVVNKWPCCQLSSFGFCIDLKMQSMDGEPHAAQSTYLNPNIRKGKKSGKPDDGGARTGPVTPLSSLRLPFTSAAIIYSPRCVRFVLYFFAAEPVSTSSVITRSVLQGFVQQ